MRRLLAILAGLALLAGCSLSGGANASQVVSGTVTVPNSTYWDFLKLGIFSGGDAGTYVYLDTKDNGGGIASYRVFYSDQDLEAAAPITPVADTSYAIAGSDDFQRTYTFELPATVPAEDVHYYYAAWYDGNLNGVLDLVDDWDPVDIPDGEYKRCATTSAAETVKYFAQSMDIFSFELKGVYKYRGEDAEGTNYPDLETSNDSGFNFAITSNAGW